jgi:phage-related tail protein
MRQKDVFHQFQKFLKETDGDFHILEQRVPVDVQMKYFKFSNQLRKSPLRLEDADYERFVDDLKNRESTKEQKQLILSTLAISKQAKSYRILKQYALETADAELTDWAYMALMESRITLESELSDEKQIYISTGLGGVGKKLRFFVLLIASSGHPFLDYQRQVIEREFTYALSKENCNIERLSIREKHVELLLLIPIQTDIKDTLGDIINECNQYGNFLMGSITITNVKELNDDEINRIINLHGSNQTKY